MIKDLISIIIPVYNVEQYLEQCLVSIAKQSITNFEVLLIDDGSTDTSPKICNEWGKKDTRFKTVHTENRGVSAARNLGLEMAEGEFIVFVDSDDWIDNTMLEKLMLLLVDSQVDIAMCRLKKCYDYDVSEKREENGCHIAYQNQDEYLKENILKQGNSCCGKIFRKDLIRDKKFMNSLTIGEDMLFLINLLNDINKVAVIEYEGYFYLQIDNSAMNRPFKKTYMDQIKCWQIAYDMLADKATSILDNISAIIIISALLVAEKIAKEPKERRKLLYGYCVECKKIVYRHRRGLLGLRKNHIAQVVILMINIKLYLLIYNKWKEKGMQNER